MPEIEMNLFPIINQQRVNGCAPACIVNILKYFGNTDYDEDILYDYLSKNLDNSVSMFKGISLIFNKIVPEFNCKYKNC